MILIGIVARPVEPESTERFQVVGILWNHRFKKEVVAQTFGNFAVNDELIPDLVYLQIDEQRRLVRIRQVCLKNNSKYC
jgi:hypothetical protein